MEKDELIAAEVERRISAGERDFSTMIILGDLVIKDIDFTKRQSGNSLNFTGTRFDGCVKFKNITIQDICLKAASVEGHLSFVGSNIKGVLDIRKLAIYNSIGLEILTKKGPSKIFVSDEMVQMIRQTAPNVPLSIVK